jgi:hypothetical protein
MDHSLGESQNYHRPTDEEILEHHLNAIDLLTISEESRLKRKVEKLEIERSQLESLALDVEQIKRRIFLN